MSQRSIEAFIARARIDPGLQRQLADCCLEQWGDSHIPLDIDAQKVIAVAAAHGFQFSMADVVAAQCQKLNEFWRFEMENSFVARRSLSLIQYQISGPAGAGPNYGYLS
ncbi:Nif11-like leader peptide family natural product precursor [Synechococcus sp. CS-1328]|uniref:Nif11-like leader peptide family natural product precursor n=1 Tax=Synechococcus sp. CS-1328 TaxID=2847976 RepID=UPI00223B172A|nr:Nif11-like leader peptide family natural product precursor [Synechococcus sp. CS-1328]MCT0223797.1 Nif11-like leader peptide family natural product precursor [Synechococcus sp. CS-1328]